MTIIQRGFKRGPLFNTVDFDQQFMDRPFIAEKELAGLTRDGKRCRSPCSQIYYDVKKSSQPNQKLHWNNWFENFFKIYFQDTKAKLWTYTRMDLWN